MSVQVNGLMEQGIHRIARTAARFYLRNPAGRRFLAGTAPRLGVSARLRAESEAAGAHVPPFLIASVASRCNLRCAGCYARAGGGCGDGHDAADLTGAQWDRVFAEAQDMGVSFVLLAGGEPFLRRDVMLAAAARPGLVFPVFTNGTVLDDDYLELLDAHRHLLPVFSVEGDAARTDARRGAGVHAQVGSAMERLAGRGALFGASVTVTAENLEQVATAEFVSELRRRGCGLVFFVEYVPVHTGTDALALDADAAAELNRRVAQLKRRLSDVIVVSFPGDEAAMGGCLAAGRGFFHINAKGGAEPCPFAPHAALSLKTHTLAQVLASPYFRQVQALAAQEEHHGGCALFHQLEALRTFTA